MPSQGFRASWVTAVRTFIHFCPVRKNLLWTRGRPCLQGYNTGHHDTKWKAGGWSGMNLVQAEGAVRGQGIHDACSMKGTRLGMISVQPVKRMCERRGWDRDTSKLNEASGFTSTSCCFSVRTHLPHRPMCPSKKSAHPVHVCPHPKASLLNAGWRLPLPPAFWEIFAGKLV